VIDVGVIDSLHPHQFAGLLKSYDQGLSWLQVRVNKSDQSIVELNFQTFGQSGIDSLTWDSLRQIYASNNYSITDYALNDPHALSDLMFMGERVFAATESGLLVIEGNHLKVYDSRQTELSGSSVTSLEKIIQGVDTLLVVGTQEDGLNFTVSWPDFTRWRPVKRKLHLTRAQSYAYPSILYNTTRPAQFAYGLRKSGRVTITVYDLAMDRIRTVIQNEPRPAAQRSEKDKLDSWDGTDDFGLLVPPGVYYYKIQSDQGEVFYGKIAVMK